MKRIRILEIIFSPEIKGYQINAFRGAIATKFGKDSILFHNHTQEGYRYSYPLIQYKRIKKKASIVCVNDGIDEIHKLFQSSDKTLNLNGQKIELRIEKINVNQFTLNVWDKYFHYKIFNWIALNTENYKKFIEAKSLTEQEELLEQILTANIISFAKGVDWHIEEEKKIKLKIIEIAEKKKAQYKGITFIAFNVDFKTNVFLPKHIGLGKAVSHGFGVIYPTKNKE